MANRVTYNEVKEIIDTSLTDISAFITAANLVVTDRLGASGLGTELLKEIERWLAAHLVAIRDPKIQVDETLDAKAVYEHGKLGEGLQFTSFGQQVLLLDSTGAMSNVSKRSATFTAIDFPVK